MGPIEANEKKGEPVSDLITMTEAAAARMKHLLADRGTPEAYVRIGTKTAGCSGLTYKLEFADASEFGDEELTLHGVKVLLDPKSLLYILGTEIDFEEEELKSGFTFKNPNKKGECGCGESFTV